MTFLKTIVLFLFPLASFAQYNATGSYLAFMYAGGNLKATEVFLDGPSANTVYANTTASYKSGVFTGQFSSRGEKKINLGGYFGFNLGGGTQKYHIDQVNSTYDMPQEGFQLFGTLKAGPQLTFVLKENELFLGVRNFYWWNIDDGLRSMYADDDGGAVGIFGGYKNLGFDFSYAPEKLSFIRKRNRYNYGQLELSYNVMLRNNGYSLLLGTRYEFTKIKDIPGGILFNTGLSTTTLANGNANLFSVFVGLGLSKKK